ncbi:hypothetical protein SK128_021636 [Halocaridina rubra]|uniref:Retinol dehydrogenase 11 n=1 Tax=Halocaridina rubra TaxID=373956 RepID=A0AAN9AAS5_HALRR
MPWWILLVLLIGSILAAIGVFGIVHRERAGVAKNLEPLDGKTVLITGASSGIGKEAAKLLAKRGARLILACRNIIKTNVVADDIRLLTGNKEVEVMELDTSSLASVRSFADKFLAQEQRLDVLILNAGMFGTLRRSMTSEGLETTMVTNHFGHFLLTNLLLGLLLQSRPSRIIVTASSLHKLVQELDHEDLNFEKGEFTQFQAYGRSKACNILFTRHLAEITRDTGVTVNAFCPGLVHTEIFDKTEGFLVGKLERLIAPFAGRTSWQGAQPILQLTASNDVENISGEYFENCKVSNNTSNLVNDLVLARKVWEASEKYAELKPEEKFYDTSST